jgi:phosphate-selective porin OprO and OprP
MQFSGRYCLRIWLASLAVMVLLSAGLNADSADDGSDMSAIRAQLSKQEAEIRLLRQRLDQPPPLVRLPAVTDDNATSFDPSVVPAASMLQEEPPGVPAGGGAKKPKPADKPPAAVKKDEFPTVKITGFTQLDDANYSQSPANRATVGDAQNGVGFRRARLAAYGKAAECTNYIIEMDFATAGRPSFFDVYGEQTQLPFLGSVRIGQYVQPFSVDAMSGFRNLPFLERSLPFLAFVPFRRVGIEAYYGTKDQRLNWAYSVFKTGGFNNAPLGDDRYATDIGNVGGYSFSGRVTYLMYYDEPADDRYLWHIGGAFDYSRLGENNSPGSGASGNAGGGPSPFYQSRVLPEFGSLGYSENSQSFGNAVSGTPTMIDSGKYAASGFELYGVETVAQSGPVSLQAEWMGTVVNSVVGNIFYNGAYGEVMYRPTGEHRPYDRATGALKNVIPFSDFFGLGRGGGIGGWGALELAARLSFVNEINPAKLNGHYYSSTTNTFTSTTGNVGNGTLTDTTLGATWFLNAHTKIQFNWIHCMLDNVVKGYSVADLFVSRFQVDF